MEFYLAALLLAALLSIPAVNAVLPNLDPVHREVVAKRGSSVNLVCRGSNVAKFDTSIWWTFNGRKIKSSTNKVATMKWLSGEKGLFSLHIRNVSEDVVGEYQCNVKVSNFGSPDTAKAVINLQLYERVLKVTTSQPNITLSEGITTTLHCKVTCSEAMDVWTFWLFNGETIAARPFHSGNEQALSHKVTNVSSLELKHVTRVQSGTYTCGANSTVMVTTQNISVRVKDAEGPTLVQAEPTVEVSDGKNETLNCVAVYPEALFVDTFWIFNGSRIRSSSKYRESESWFGQPKGNIKRRNLALTIYNIGLNDTGEYKCVLNTSHGLRHKSVKVRVRMETTRTPKSGNATTSDFSTSRLKDKGNADLLGTTLFIGLGLLVGLLTTAILSLKLWRRRRQRLQYPESITSPPDVDETNFEYDVFITYSRKDATWVDNELLGLFNNNQVKYCVDHLHFELGKAFLENMAEGVYKSRKVLAVWSANYASSKYCKQELDYALQRSFEKSDSAVIVIRLDGTDRKQLPKPLRARTFLDYSDSVERKGWEKRLIKHLTVQTHKTQTIGTMV